MSNGRIAPHNLGTTRIRRQVWSGIEVLALQQDVLPGQAWHQISSDHPLLSIVVNETGGRCEARPTIDAGQSPAARARQRGMGHTSLIPAGMPVWGYSDDIARVDEVRLTLDLEQMSQVIGALFPPGRLNEPQLMVFDERLQALARLLAASDDEAATSALFGDSVMTAMIAQLARLEPLSDPSHRRLGLSNSQLAQATTFMREHLAAPIRLVELARLADLSASQFGRAFRVSTGSTPFKWHMDARIDMAKHLLANPRYSLVEIALETGFSEQSRFSSAFRAATGAAPSVWRRNQMN